MTGPAPVLCGDCGHPRADHRADLEGCNAEQYVIRPDDSIRVEWCDCRGWTGRPINRGNLMDLPARDDEPVYELGGEAGGA